MYIPARLFTCERMPPLKKPPASLPIIPPSVSSISSHTKRFHPTPSHQLKHTHTHIPTRDAHSHRIPLAPPHRLARPPILPAAPPPPRQHRLPARLPRLPLRRLVRLLSDEFGGMGKVEAGERLHVEEVSGEEGAGCGGVGGG